MLISDSSLACDLLLHKFTNFSTWKKTCLSIWLIQLLALWIQKLKKITFIIGRCLRCGMRFIGIDLIIIAAMPKTETKNLHFICISFSVSRTIYCRPQIPLPYQIQPKERNKHINAWHQSVSALCGDRRNPVIRLIISPDIRPCRGHH